LFDQEALDKQRAAERRLAFEQLPRTQPAGALLAMSGASMEPVAAGCDELHVVAGQAHVMQIVGIVVAIC
jgi:hypothetical protein